jgi:DNA-binding NtrC family response regulator
MSADLPEPLTFQSHTLGESAGRSTAAKALVFVDPASRSLLDYIEKVAPSEAPILIYGETGTGKELVARHVHHLSGRTGPFLAVNCGAISEHLAESELFGHESGSFTGAVGRREGWFEAANGGTLFLDEIGDLSLPLQVKLLRVLQEHEVVRIGSRKSIPVDVRLVAATNVDLQRAVETGRFRRDLLYRLNIVQLRLAPLCERPGDILPLTRHFLQTYSRRLRKPLHTLSQSATDTLLRHPWPGNIRELENVVHLAVLTATADEIQAADLKVSPDYVGAGSQGWAGMRAGPARGKPDTPTEALASISLHLRRCFADPGDALFQELERLIVTEAYRYCGHNQVQAAALLGISRNVLRTMLKRHGLLGESPACDRPSEGTPGRSWFTDTPDP